MSVFIYFFKHYSTKTSAVLDGCDIYFKKRKLSKDCHSKCAGRASAKLEVFAFHSGISNLNLVLSQPTPEAAAQNFLALHERYVIILVLVISV